MNGIGEDPEGDALSYLIDTPPVVGSAQIIGGSILNYTYSNFDLLVENQVVTIDVVANDGDLDSDPEPFIFIFITTKGHIPGIT